MELQDVVYILKVQNYQTPRKIPGILKSHGTALIPLAKVSDYIFIASDDRKRLSAFKPIH